MYNNNLLKMKLALLLFCLARLFNRYFHIEVIGNKQDNCYFPNQCEFIDEDNWYESVLICKSLYPKFDEKRFNETLNGCKKFKYITTHGKVYFTMIVKPENNDFSSRILQNSSSFEIDKIINSLGPTLENSVLFLKLQHSK